MGDGGFLLASNPDTVRGPDVAFVTCERWSAVTDRGRYFRGAPDLAIEILSPSNRSGEIHAKVADYLAAGARDVLDGGEVLPGFLIPVEAVFAE